MDINTKVKSRVLQQLIDMMDEKMIGDLKSKSPKFAKVDIQSDDPKLAETLKDNLISGITEDDQEDPSKEMTPEDFNEDNDKAEDPMNETDHESPKDEEDIKRLLDMYKNLK